MSRARRPPAPPRRPDRGADRDHVADLSATSPIAVCGGRRRTRRPGAGSSCSRPATTSPRWSTTSERWPATTWCCRCPRAVTTRHVWRPTTPTSSSTAAASMSAAASSAHRLHPDLALLLSTSGSTGSPKLVRLSRRNLVANATAIADYLDIRETDRAATTLPMSYCYGLSVVHSHLLRGAALILTDHSVVDDEFWALFRRHRGTSFAGVPYTFDMLERIGFDEHRSARSALRHPGRRATRPRNACAASPRSATARVGSCSSCTARRRPPPEWPTCHRNSRSRSPSSIGRPIPGGSFTIEPVDGWSEPDVGELVYHGPNVMMGYAHAPADLCARQDRRHPAHRRHRAPDTRRALRGDRPQQPLREAVRPAHRSAAGGGRPARRRRDAPSAPTTTTGCVVAAVGHDEHAVQRITAVGIRPSRRRHPRRRR